jgi:hypothetical protein
MAVHYHQKSGRLITSTELLAKITSLKLINALNLDDVSRLALVSVFDFLSNRGDFDVLDLPTLPTSIASSTHCEHLVGAAQRRGRLR